jgi:probable rRNA maturation factor
MHLNIISECHRRIPRKNIIRLFDFIEEDEEPPDSTINVIFIRDRQMRGLNRDYRNIDRPTDVLSFNIDDEPGEQSVLGEIYISVDTAAVNAESEHLTFSDELLKLCCHGFLHLLGYDHEINDDALLMEAREKYYLEKMKR